MIVKCLRYGVTVSMRPFQGLDPGSTPGIGILTDVAQLVEHVAFMKGESLATTESRVRSPPSVFFYNAN
jgi:hypothetical protein